MIEELRISSLGVIDASTLELGPGFTVVTGETGAGKTMVVTALGLLLGGRADSGAVRVGARQARIEGVVRADGVDGLAAAVEEAGGEVEDDVVVLARNVSAEGRSRAFVGGAGVPVATLAEIAEPLVAVHGQSDQHRLLKAATQRAALDVYAGDAVVRAARPLSRPLRPPIGHRARAGRGGGIGPGASAGSRPAPVRRRRDRGGRTPAR